MKIRKLLATIMFAFVAILLLGIGNKVNAKEVELPDYWYWDASQYYVDESGTKFEYAHLFYDEEHTKPISNWCVILTVSDVSKKIVIPDYIDGYEVALLGNSYVGFVQDDNVYEDTDFVKEVVMPDTVKYIASMSYISAAEKITFSKNLKEIGPGTALWFGPNIKSIVLPESLEKIGGWGIEGSGLKTITIKSMNVALSQNCIYVGPDTEKNVTIKCYKGSTAEKYAKENGFKCEYIKPSKVSSVKATSKSSKMTVTWKKATGGVTGYELVISRTSSFIKGTISKKVIKKSTTTKQVISKCANKKLAASKKYYVKVRAYKLVNGKKVYGKYSKVVKVTVKK